MISRFIQTSVEAKLRQITLTEVWINLDTMRKPNSIIVLLYNSEIVANLDEDAINSPCRVQTIFNVVAGGVTLRIVCRLSTNQN